MEKDGRKRNAGMRRRLVSLSPRANVFRAADVLGERVQGSMRAAVKGRPLLCCRFFTLGSQRPLSSRRACGGSCFPRSHEAGEFDLRWVDDLERFVSAMR